MKVYKVIVNEVASDPAVCVSSYVAPRTLRKEEFYSNKESADKRVNEIYEGMQKLVGFIPKVEARVVEIEVSE